MTPVLYAHMLHPQVPMGKSRKLLLQDLQRRPERSSGIVSGGTIWATRPSGPPARRIIPPPAPARSISWRSSADRSSTPEEAPAPDGHAGHLAKPLGDPLPHPGGPGREILLLDHVERRERRRAGERVGDEGRGVERLPRRLPAAEELARGPGRRRWACRLPAPCRSRGGPGGRPRARRRTSRRCGRSR